MTRRSFFLFAVLAGGFGAAPAATSAAETRKPNIVLILSDDLGWKDTGFNGSDFYETPNLDKLKQESMVFNHAYVGGANCQPSRACLMSGQYTPRHGVYAVASTDRGPKNMMRMVPVPNKPYLEGENFTMAEALKAAGYATGHFGKWHLSGPAGTFPKDQGFDFTMDHKKQGTDEDPKGLYSIAKAACEFMEKNKDRPFFAYVAHHAIHGPLEARKSTLAKFKAKQPGTQHKNPLYAACIYDHDDGVGIVLKKIADLGLEKNTLLIFTSDNGATQNSSQEPLRGNKGCYYEGGIREPFLVRWPGVVKPGTKCDVPIILLDLYPTYLEAAGATVPPKDKVLDGESLLPLFKGGTALSRPSIFWHFPGYLNDPVIRGRDPVFRTRPVSAIRKGDWKLLLYHEEWQLDGGRQKVSTNNAVELYNLAADEGERKNLVNENTTKRDELLDDLVAWMKATNAKMPTEKNAAYKPDAAAKTKKMKVDRDK